MEQIQLEIHEDVVAAIAKIKEAKETDLELQLPEGSVLFENSLNLKLLKREAGEIGRAIHFATADPAGKVLIELLEENGNGGGSSQDFVPREVSVDSVVGTLGSASTKTKRKLSLPKFGLNLGFFKNIQLSGLKLGNFSGKKAYVLLAGGIVVLVLMGWGVYQLLWTVPKAEVTLVVSSQPLIKSVEVSVAANSVGSSQERILNGTVVETTITEILAKEPTGEKLVGVKATGQVKILNKTDEEAEFDSGEELEDQDTDLKYIIDDDVTVPAATPAVNPLDPNVPGEALVDVIAADIGSNYNLDEGQVLKFDDYDITKYVASVTEDIDGGESETVKVVSQEDLDTLSADLTAQISGKGADALKGAVGQNQVLIEGSNVSALVTEEFNAELDEEAEELTLTKTMSFRGLAYNSEELEDLLEELLKEFVPSGFELSEEEREINAEILGNTDATVLNISEADLQVTIKSYVLPEIDEEKLINELAGVSIAKAEEILGKVRNAKTYSINVDPNIPLLRRMPKNTEDILLKIQRE